MSRRASAKPAGVQMFPFLAVLICTMGALVVLLHAFARHGRLHAIQVAEANAPPPEFDVEDYQWRIDHIRAARAKTKAQLADERLKLSHVEDHARRLRAQLAELASAAEKLETAGAAEDDQNQRRAAELDAVKSELAAARAALDAAQAKAGSGGVNYSVVPYEGPNGTQRPPIYIECRADTIVLQPEGIELTPQDFGGNFGPSNPLAAAVRAQREYYARQGADDEPYPLLLVRPDGIEAYLRSRRALDSWGSDFGYELVGADWKLEFRERDPELAKLMQQVVAEARVRHRQYVLTSPSAARRRSRPTYRARAHGGFEQIGGDPYHDQVGGSSIWDRARVGGGYGGTGGRSGGGTSRNGGRTDGYGGGNNYGGGADRYGQRGSGYGGADGSAEHGNGYSGGDGRESGADRFSERAGGYGGGTGNDPYGYAARDGAAASGGRGGSAWDPSRRGVPGGGRSDPSTLSDRGGAAAHGSQGSLLADGSGPGGDGAGPNAPGNSSPRGGASSGGNGDALRSAEGKQERPETATGRGRSANGDGLPGDPTGSLLGTPDGQGGPSGEAGQPAGSAQGTPGGTETAGGPQIPGATSSEGPSQSAPGTGGGTPSSGNSHGGDCATCNSPGGAAGQSSQQSVSIQHGGDRARESIAAMRGHNWGLPGYGGRSMAASRPIRVWCYSDRLVIPSPDRSRPPEEIRFDSQTIDSVDELVSAVWGHMKSWGTPGRGLHWRPVISMDVQPGGEPRFADIQVLLANSGIDVERRRTQSAQQRRPVQPSRTRPFR